MIQVAQTFEITHLDYSIQGTTNIQHLGSLVLNLNVVKFGNHPISNVTGRTNSTMYDSIIPNPSGNFSLNYPL